MSNMSLYIKHIDAPWIMEIINERFDNATDLMTGNSIVYGGAIRDAIAEMPLLGDLDISVSTEESDKLSKMFSGSSKWVMTHNDGKKIAPLMPRLSSPKKNMDEAHIPVPGRRGGLVQKPFISMHSGDRGYGRHVPISSLVTFTTIGGIKVQIMTSKSPHNDRFEDALFVPRNVDIRCCGVAMDRDGNVYEVVEGAYQDCKDRVLRVNKLTAALDVPRMIERIAKFEKRGWKNEINIKKVEREVNRLAEKEKRLEKIRIKKERERGRRMREKFEKDIAEESKTLKGKQLSEMSDIERFETLKMSQKSFTTDVSYEQLSHIKIDDFVGIIQDVCVEENITAQVHPFEDRLIIETLTSDDSDKIMRITWEVADQEFPPPQEVAEEFHPPYEVVEELGNGEVVGFVGGTITAPPIETHVNDIENNNHSKDFILHAKVSDNHEIKLMYRETSPEQDARVIIYDDGGMAINQITVENFQGNTQSIMRLLENLIQEITIKFKSALMAQQKPKTSPRPVEKTSIAKVEALPKKIKYPGPLLRQKADFSPEKRIKDYAMNMLKSSKAKEIKYLKKGM